MRPWALKTHQQGQIQTHLEHTHVIITDRHIALSSLIQRRMSLESTPANDISSHTRDIVLLFSTRVFVHGCQCLSVYDQQPLDGFVPRGLGRSSSVLAKKVKQWVSCFWQHMASFIHMQQSLQTWAGTSVLIVFTSHVCMCRLPVTRLVQEQVWTITPYECPTTCHS